MLSEKESKELFMQQVREFLAQHNEVPSARAFEHLNVPPLPIPTQINSEVQPFPIMPMYPVVRYNDGRRSRCCHGSVALECVGCATYQAWIDF
jgi:hypothetical protein